MLAHVYILFPFGILKVEVGGPHVQQALHRSGIRLDTPSRRTPAAQFPSPSRCIILRPIAAALQTTQLHSMPRNPRLLIYGI